MKSARDSIISPAWGRDLRRYRGWVFTWRPWWARLWRRDKWVVAHAENVAAIIVAEVNA